MAKLLVFVALLALAGLAAALPRPDDKYTTKYDNIDIDEILASKRLLQNYMNCILEKPNARCTPDALEIKKSIPDALTNGCAKCSEKQKTLTDKVVYHLLDNERDSWVELKTKYDPSGIFEKKYEKTFQEKGMKV